MLRHIPNTLTCLNLICGATGIIFLLEGRGIDAAWFVWASCVFDFFDGFAARMLKVTSAIGKELDSLADMVSFGLLPSVVMYQLIDESTENAWLPFLALTIAAFSALRLAKFNIDERQLDTFIGLNTPANTIFISSLPFLKGTIGDWFFSTPSLLAITFIFSGLLVSEIEIFAFKFKNFSWADNKIRFTFLLLSVLLLALLKLTALPLIIILYVLFSLVSKAFAR